MEIRQIQVGDKTENINKTKKKTTETLACQRRLNSFLKNIYLLVDLIEGSFLKTTEYKKFVYLNRYVNRWIHPGLEIYQFKYDKYFCSDIL